MNPKNDSGRSRSLVTFIGVAILVAATFSICTCKADAQPAQPQTAEPNTQAADKNTPEMSSHEEAPTFTVNVSLVLVRVVVRDAKGQPVGNLRKEDFQLLDNHKPEVITQFSIEHPAGQLAKEIQATETPASENPTANIPNVPERFVAYVFDDLHLQTSDLLSVRAAAERHLGTLRRTDRAAIFTTSGHTNVDFTDDRDKLRTGLLRLAPSPLRTDVNDCPSVSYYMADMIVNKNDKQALGIVTQEVSQCLPGLASQVAQQIAQSAAQRAVTTGNSEARLALASLEDLLRRMASMPGQRTMVLVSPGFITPYLDQEVSDVIDLALRANIIVSTLDARGLYVPAAFRDISRRDSNVVTPQATLYNEGEDSANDDVLATLADSTGGVFFHNNDDMEAGLKQAGEPPAFYYLLGFSPQNLKYDGRFHGITVELVNHPGLNLQARKGYYAPKKAPNADEEAKQEIQEVLFSREEMHDLPVDLHTQWFKSNDVNAKLSVLIHVDVKRLHYQRANGRNNNNLTIATALFDHNGSFISGNEKTLNMHLKDDTLEHKLDPGVTVKTGFDVKPGGYLVRLVVRDAEGLLSAENAAIEIPGVETGVSEQGSQPGTALTPSQAGKHESVLSQNTAPPAELTSLPVVSLKQPDQQIRFDVQGMPPTDLSITPNEIFSAADTSHCHALAAGNLRMSSLSQVCEFALTFRRDLPDFICEQKTTSTLTRQGIIQLDAQHVTVFKAQVTFEKGHERYSDITMNGRPLDAKSAAAAGAMNFISFGELGSDLVDLFTQPIVAEFQFRREANLSKVPVSIYSFHIPADKNTFWGVSDYRKMRLHPEYEGELWIARNTARLLRLELHPVHLPPDFGFSRADTTIDYTETTITDAGTFLLPSTSVTKACTRNQESAQCSQNVLIFHNCRKFGSKARIIPQ